MGNGSIVDPQEFWNALGRLYDSTLHLRDATAALAETARLHEKRHDKAEVTLLAFYEEFRDMKAELARIRQRLDELDRPLR